MVITSGTARWTSALAFAVLAILFALQSEYLRSDLMFWLEEYGDEPLSETVTAEERREWIRSRPWLAIFDVTKFKGWGISEQDVFYAFRLLFSATLVAIAVWLWLGRSLRQAALAFVLFAAASLLYRYVIGPIIYPNIKLIVDIATFPLLVLDKDPHPLLNTPARLGLRLAWGIIDGAITALITLAPLCLLDARFRAPKAWLLMILLPLLISSFNMLAVIDLVKAHIGALPRSVNRYANAVDLVVWAGCLGYAAARSVQPQASIADPETRRRRRTILLITIAIAVVGTAAWAWAVWDLFHQRSLLPPPMPVR